MERTVKVSEAAIALRVAPRRRRRLHWREIEPVVLLAPSMLAIAFFVYTFIAGTFYASLSNWKSIRPDLSYKGFSIYETLFKNARFQHDLRNVLLLALLLDQKIRGIPFFRNAFLFPMAVSFVVAGVAFQWVFNPAAGINQLIERVGINHLLIALGHKPFAPNWIADPTVAFVINDFLARIIPAVGGLRVKLGIPLALLPVVLAATWQFSGFAMASYLGGLATIPDELREAARIDGANEFQVYRHIIVPMLHPVTISLLFVLGHISLKIFDLIYAMTGSGPGFATDVPAIFVFEITFKALKYNLGAAAAMVMFVMVVVVIAPYLYHQLQKERSL
jgi:glucose/mannose transport system permease protein